MGKKNFILNSGKTVDTLDDLKVYYTESTQRLEDVKKNKPDTLKAEQHDVFSEFVEVLNYTFSKLYKEADVKNLPSLNDIEEKGEKKYLIDPNTKEQLLEVNVLDGKIYVTEEALQKAQEAGLMNKVLDYIGNDKKLNDNLVSEAVKNSKLNYIGKIDPNKGPIHKAAHDYENISKVHENRGFFNKLIHPIKNRNEAKTLNELENYLKGKGLNDKDLENVKNGEFKESVKEEAPFVATKDDRNIIISTLLNLKDNMDYELANDISKSLLINIDQSFKEGFEQTNKAATALLYANMNKIHESRSIWSRLAHPIEYRREAQNIKMLENNLKFKGFKDADIADAKNYTGLVDEAHNDLNQDINYIHAFEAGDNLEANIQNEPVIDPSIKNVPMPDSLEEDVNLLPVDKDKAKEEIKESQKEMEKEAEAKEDELEIEDFR